MPHIHEKFDFTVGVFIVHDGRVLLVNHPRYDKWLSPGGHIELDETPDQALFREVAEETGLEVEVLSIKPPFESAGTEVMFTPNFVDVHEANAPHKHIGLIYFARAKNNHSKISDEHTDMKWFAPHELGDERYGLSSAIKFYANEAIKLEAADRDIDKPA